MTSRTAARSSVSSNSFRSVACQNGLKVCEDRMNRALITPKSRMDGVETAEWGAIPLDVQLVNLHRGAIPDQRQVGIANVGRFHVVRITSRRFRLSKNLLVRKLRRRYPFLLSLSWTGKNKAIEKKIVRHPFLLSNFYYPRMNR